jgi:hypothetical protein
MTPEKLFETLTVLTNSVITDARWPQEKDDLGVSVLGMLLYGYGLAVGRMVMMLEIEDINAAVQRCLVERVGAAEKWSGGLVAAAATSAVDPTYHPGYTSLIEAGHDYMGEPNVSAMVDHVFANIQHLRR